MKKTESEKASEKCLASDLHCSEAFIPLSKPFNPYTVLETATEGTIRETEKTDRDRQRVLSLRHPRVLYSPRADRKTARERDGENNRQRKRQNEKEGERKIN